MMDSDLIQHMEVSVPTLRKHEALAAISVLLPLEFSDNVHGKDAVVELICATHKTQQREIASRTIDMLLDRFENKRASRRHLYVPEVGLLVRALRLSLLWVPNAATAERLVQSAAHQGFNSWFPGLPTRLLGRDPSVDEVVALVSAYVNKTGSQCTQEEERLKDLARKYLSPEDAARQCDRIRLFVEEWNKNDLY